MKYWAYINNEVGGPFEIEKLVKLPNFGHSSLICPQTTASGQSADWKAASTYPEVLAALTSPAPAPAPVSPQRRAAESPFAITMRGSLILDPSDPDAALAPPGIIQLQKSGGSSVSGMPDAVKLKTPAAFSLEPIATVNSGVSKPPKETPKPVSEDRLFSKTPSVSPGFGGQTSTPDKMPAMSENILTRQELNSQLEPLRQKLEQMGVMLASIGDSRSQHDMLGRLSRLESAILDIKASLAKPKKDA